jgi:peptidoglycan/LPS O-acetylase OafA/YrhL
MLPYLALPMAFSRWNRAGWTALFLVSLFQVGVAVAGVPRMPEQISNPVPEIILPCLAYGYLARNAGMLMGLQGPWSLLPLAVVAGGLAALGLRLCGREDRIDTSDDRSPWSLSVSLVCAAAVLVGLVTIKTSPRTQVHQYRAKLLADAARILQSEPLHRAARREHGLSLVVDAPDG